MEVVFSRAGHGDQCYDPAALLEGFLASTGLDLTPSVTPTIRER
jgi:hypothetical protein